MIELPFTTGGDTASLDPFKVLRLGVSGSGGVIEFGLREGGRGGAMGGAREARPTPSR